VKLIDTSEEKQAWFQWEESKKHFGMVEGKKEARMLGKSG